MPRTVFDVPALKARQQDLEQLAAQPEFWNDQQNAQKQMRRLDEVMGFRQKKENLRFIVRLEKIQKTVSLRRLDTCLKRQICHQKKWVIPRRLIS